jgi:hypothetical protein
MYGRVMRLPFGINMCTTYFENLSIEHVPFSFNDGKYLILKLF